MPKTTYSEMARRMVRRIEAAFTFPRGKRLIRPRYPRMIAGVCSGMSEAFGWDLTLLRLLVVVLTVASSGLLAAGYAVAWVLIPEGAYTLPNRAGTSIP